MNLDRFVQQLESMQGRLTQLYQGAGTPTSLMELNLLPAAFKELGTASEELQMAAEELSQQNEQLLFALQAVETERQHYRELFNLVPDSYLITDINGLILEANRAAAELFSMNQSYLIGKPLVTFVPAEERSYFRAKLNSLHQQNGLQEWILRLRSRDNDPFDAVTTVATIRDCEDQLIKLRWLIHTVNVRNTEIPLRTRALLKSDLKQTELLTNTNGSNSNQNHPLYTYSKGEVILLETASIWKVQQGLVKLSTLSENGEETVVGLAGPLTPFGASLTSLSVYQASAMSEEVQLVRMPLADIISSSELMQDYLSWLGRRVHQAERLLAVAGQRRVKDRLYHFLQLLKQEVGQPVPEGTRLGVRLTHEDLASACCTTRVTITRLLGKLQQQQKILLDSKHHIILRQTEF